MPRELLSRRLFLLSSAALLLSGCGTISRHAPFSPTTALPPFYPNFPSPFTALIDQLITVSFAEAARQGGAPAEVPELRAMLNVKADSLDLALFALHQSVWRLLVSPAGLQESRHPLLDGHVQARAFLRDLTFCLWPETALREMIAQTGTPDKWSLSVTETRRILSSGDVRLFDMEVRDGITVLNNYPEGYTLTIRTAPPQP